MTPSNTKSNEEPCLRLSEELDLATAQLLKDAILEHIRSNEVIKLDGSDVKRITTPCVQVLLAANRMVSAEGGEFFLSNPSEAITATFADLGLQSELNKWSVN
jgi:anti-anti-sigma factor